MSIDPLAATIPAPASPDPAPLSPGDVVADRYRIEAMVGRGAMGVVYRVEHVLMHKRFALKVLGPHWVRAPEARERFEREAIAGGSIADPHVAQATDFGILADGSCFLVLEYVDGRTLRSVLDRGALRPRRALGIARGIAAALQAAHSRGVVHRDLKPANIMLLEQEGDPDYVKVLDFGLASFESPAGSPNVARALTRQGAILGTPAYMSPEQAMGKPVDVRADLYAVGVILFEMLTGDCPFRGDAVAVVQQHVMKEPPPLPRSTRRAAGERVAQVLERLLAKEPGGRYASAGELLAALESCEAALATREQSSWSSLLLTRLSGFAQSLQPSNADIDAQRTLGWPRRLVARLVEWQRRRRRRKVWAERARLGWVRGWLVKRKKRVRVRVRWVLAAAAVALALAGTIVFVRRSIERAAAATSGASGGGVTTQRAGTSPSALPRAPSRH